ncbi:DUF2059 domain-containing protein [Anaeromyxobacter terrae]|uniref:DUF2059 domain-containing protein n=1 Tax=Anaeromyxobacter terrae TaxID=2925406 RepID=UPI001F57E435|nr:DUF2059 domain-containing protein [Anaeromyxobacter sp. SG22]
MSLSRRLAVAAVLSTLAAPAFAAAPAPAAKPPAPAPAAKPPAPAAKPPDAAKPAAAKPAAVELKPSAAELARVLMPKKTWDAGLGALAKNVQSQMQAHPGAKLEYPRDFDKQVRNELEAALPYEALLDVHAKELSASYTEPELKDLLAFYKTPTGQKSLEVMPAVSQKIALQTQQRVESKMPAIMEKLAGKVKMPAGGKAAPSPHGAMPPGHGAMGGTPTAPQGATPAAPAAKPAK